MQISQVNQKELMLLIAGLRAIHISDSVKEKHKLLIQLEQELSTRYGVKPMNEYNWEEWLDNSNGPYMI